MAAAVWRFFRRFGTRQFFDKYDNAGAGGFSASRLGVGVIVATKWLRNCKLFGFWLGAIGLLSLAGCGGGGTANVVTVSVLSSTSVLILNQAANLTATVNGATNVKVTWKCQYTTTPTPASGTTPTPTSPVDCPTDGTFGAISNQQDTSTGGTATYTAPSKLPDQTKFPQLRILIVATSVQDTKKTGQTTLLIDSGISISLTPFTATVAVGEQQQFSASLTNDTPPPQGAKWLLTQDTITSASTIASLKVCDAATCGTITPGQSDPNVAIYTAPSAVPKTPSMTIVTYSAADNTRVAIGTITIIAGGPISFNGITPTIAPVGAVLWDIYLDAPNITSASTITVTDPNGGHKDYKAITGQVKILFPIPTSTTANPSSSGARLRLSANPPLPGGTGDLLVPGLYTVSVTDPVQTVPPTTFSFTALAVRPTVIASIPDGIVQGANLNQFPMTIDGGFFGFQGQAAQAIFQGIGIPQDANNPSSARQLHLAFPSGAVNGPPGLFPLSVANKGAAPAPPNPSNPAVTNLAVFPDYSTAPPQVVGSAVPAGTNPSAIDIDPTLGVAVVAETGSNAIRFYSIGQGSLTLLSTVTTSNTPGITLNVPTGVSVDRVHHTVAVVSYGVQAKDASGNFLPPTGQSVTLLPIPGAPGTPTTPFSVDISGALQGAVPPLPMPYAIGLDPDTNLAMVAYSSTSTSSAANLGFIVNLNLDGSNNPFGCPLSTATTPPTGQCLFAQVTLNTGAYPQIAMAPHGHLAFVTPGGSGVIRGVDVTKASNSTPLKSLSIAAGVVTVTTTVSHGLVPGSATTVLISGVALPNTTANPTTANFNGVFVVSPTSSTQFNYVLSSPASGTADGTGAEVFYGGPNLIFSISQHLQGIAINPITSTAALADADATGGSSFFSPQIDLLNSLDQSTSSISFSAGCTAFTSPCSGSVELLGTTAVAWQPFTNSLVSYNPGTPGAPVNQVSVSDPVTRKRYALISLSGTGATPFAVQNGSTNSLTLWGGLAVDPATNQAFVVQSGSGTISVIDLGPSPVNTIKSIHINELVVPSPTPGPGVIGGLRNALVPQAALTCIPTPPAPPSSCDLPNVQIFGTGFAAGAQVFLDGVDITTQGGSITNIAANGREMDVTIPSFFLSFPHRFALVVTGNGVQSNATEFLVIQSVDLSNACTGTNAQPTSVAIADQLANGPFSPIAVVTNSGCNNFSIIDIAPGSSTFGQLIGNPVSVGTTPQGIAIYQPHGLAVVANNGSHTVSIIDLTKNPPAPAVPDVTVGTNPTGIAVNDATGVAVVTNTGSNNISTINLGLLFPPPATPPTTPPTTLTAAGFAGVQEPVAVAIDPDRGANNQGVAMVSSVQPSSGLGTIAAVDIGLTSPAASTTAFSCTVSATPSGIVFDPAASSNSAHPGLFYANSSGTNQISTCNPDSGGAFPVSVGINPTSLAVNPQTGAILTSNTAGKSISIVDTLTNPFRTRRTLGIPGSPTFGVAIDQFTNLAVIVDQANNRVLLFPIPN